LSHISQELGLRSLFLKDEGVNPTGTFKARGLSVATSKAKELGINKFIIPTAGNAGGALAAYAARGSIDALIVMPRDTPQATISEIQAYGAQIRFVQGFIDEAARVSLDLARSEGWFDFSTFKEPNRLEGKKTLGYELAEFFDWRMPDVIIYPTGGGTGLVGMWKAIQEIFALGWFDHPTIPKFVLVQPDGCAPLVRAFDNGDFESQTWSNPKTIASGLRVPKSFADRLILRIVRESQGTAIAVNEKEILDAQRDLAIKEGIFAAPEGAATLAGLIRLFDMGWFKPDERIVIFNTGSGLKYI
jgi:threonine synthase